MRSSFVLIYRQNELRLWCCKPVDVQTNLPGWLMDSAGTDGKRPEEQIIARQQMQVENLNRSSRIESLLICQTQSIDSHRGSLGIR